MRRPTFKRLAAATLALGVLAPPLAIVGVVADRYLERRADARRLDEALTQLDADDPDWHVLGVVKAHNGAVPADDADNATRAALHALTLRPASRKARQTAVATNDIPDLEWDDDRLPHDDAICSLYEVHLDSGDAHRVALATRTLTAGGLPIHFADPDPFATLLPDVQRVREVADLLKDYATVEAYLGRGDEALRAADAGLHVAQVTLATEPMLISQLVRMACCGVAAGSVQQTLAWTEPAEGLAELQAALARAATVDGIAPGLRGERASVLRIYDNVRSGALPPDFLSDPFGRVKADWTERVERRLKGRSVVRDQADSLRILNDFLDAAKLRGPARRTAFAAVESRIDRDVGQLLPAVSKCVAADDRLKARLLSASVGLACERYRRQVGHFPKALADIPTALLPAIPTDPFSDDPLCYKVLADGAVVFSVGPDGLHAGEADPGLLTQSALARALGFRLWNPDSRRRPPRPWPEPEATDDAPEVPAGDMP